MGYEQVDWDKLEGVIPVLRELKLSRGETARLNILVDVLAKLAELYQATKTKPTPPDIEVERLPDV
jgi:hypothetical protein